MIERVLVAINSITIRTHLIDLLREAGFHPVAAASPQNALVSLESDSFTIGLFGADLGSEVEPIISEFRRRFPDAHTVLIGNYAVDTGLADDTFSSNFDDEAILRNVAEARRAGKGKLLVVDDSQTYRRALSDALRQNGYTVIDAASGEEALVLALNERPVGFIVDNGLPGIDGTTVIRRLRQSPATRSTPSLLLTASEDPNQEVRALEAGADTFIRKDQELDVIVARVSAMLRSASTRLSLEVSPRYGRRGKVVIAGGDRTNSTELLATLKSEGLDAVVMHSPEDAATLLTSDVDAAIYAFDDDEVVDRLVRAMKSKPETRHARAIRIGRAHDRKAVISALNAGVDDFVVSDAGMDILMARVRAQIRRKQMEDETRDIAEGLLRRQLEAEAQRAVAEARAARAEELNRAKMLAEEKAREAERVTAQLHSIFANLAEGIIICDLDGKVVYVNDAALQFHGLERRDLLDQHVSRLGALYEAHYPEGHLMAEDERPLSRALRGEHATGVEALLVRRRDRHAWIGSFNVTPIRKADGQQILAAITIRDITSQKRAEEALRKSEKLAATGRLAAAIAHEINNPLEAITNLLYLLESDVKDPRLLEFIHTAQRETERVSHITKQTLAFHRDTTEPVEVDLRDLANELLPVYRNYAGKYGVTVTLDLQCQATMRGFPGELRQVIGNLISNAIDAAAAMHGVVKVRVHSQPRQPASGAKAVTVVVSDNGSGMTPDVLGQIFQPFFTTKRSRGTGLGLWVADSIITKHHGHLRLRTCTDGPRRGTTFRIVFPLEAEIRRDFSDDVAELFRAIGRELLQE